MVAGVLHDQITGVRRRVITVVQCPRIYYTDLDSLSCKVGPRPHQDGTPAGHSTAIRDLILGPGTYHGDGFRWKNTLMDWLHAVPKLPIPSPCCLYDSGSQGWGVIRVIITMSSNDFRSVITRQAAGESERPPQAAGLASRSRSAGRQHRSGNLRAGWISVVHPGTLPGA